MAEDYTAYTWTENGLPLEEEGSYVILRDHPQGPLGHPLRGALGAQAKLDVNAECDTALTDYDAVVPADLPTNFGDLAITATTGEVTLGAGSEPGSITGHTASREVKIDEIYAFTINKATENKDTGAFALRNNADSADIGTGTNSDDGTTFTRGTVS